MKQLKNIIFDLGNVIIPLENEKHWWNEVFLEIFEIPEDVQYLKDNHFFVQYEKGQMTTDQFLKRLQQYLKPEFNENDIIDRWNALLKEIPESRIEFLQQLKKKYPIFLLSNTNEIHLDFIIDASNKKYGFDILDKTFDYCFYSYKMKEVKPAAAIYLKVLEEQNLIADECLFIDDKIENLKQAEKLGIHTKLFDSYQEINIELKELLNKNV